MKVAWGLGSGDLRLEKVADSGCKELRKAADKINSDENINFINFTYFNE